jgi:aldose 1-epimerase
MNITEKVFGTLPCGEKVRIFTLSNDNSITVKITNYGGIVQSILTPDKNGNIADVVLGFDTLEEYINKSPYFGCIVGRYANRIAKGRFKLENTEYVLAKNTGNNHLHGGNVGFDKVSWEPKISQSKDNVSLELTYLSKDGEEGYPGNLLCKVIYTLTCDDELKIQYHATTDKTTVVNLTNHSYFNLAGHDSGKIYNHVIQIFADKYTEVDENLLPTGRIVPLAGTALDLTSPVKLGEGIGKVSPGFDHNYVLNNDNASVVKAAEIYEPSSGRIMQTFTDEPGIQFYTGNFLDGIKGKNAVYEEHTGLCLETQHYPDSPNIPDFPSTVLKPGMQYSSQTTYKFAVKHE